MSIADSKKRFRELSENALRVDTLERMRKAYPETTRPSNYDVSPFWSKLFVPVYRRLPWGLKTVAMKRTGMTAKGWTPPPRIPGTPWQPPKMPPPGE
jgi:hypothetical protein